MPNPALPVTELNRVAAPQGQPFIRFDSPIDAPAFTQDGEPLDAGSSVDSTARAAAAEAQDTADAAAASLSGKLDIGAQAADVDPSGSAIAAALDGKLSSETDPVVGAITGLVKADGAGGISAAAAGTDYVAAETDPVVGAITGLVKADGAGNISAAVPGTDYVTPGGSETDPVVGAISGLVKADGAGNIAAAVPGTDYVAAETDPVVGAITGLVKADGAGNISAATIGVDYAPPGAYLTAETDPIVGAINGLVKSDGAGNISAAVAGTDYIAAQIANPGIAYFTSAGRNAPIVGMDIVGTVEEGQGSQHDPLTSGDGQAAFNAGFRIFNVGAGVNLGGIGIPDGEEMELVFFATGSDGQEAEVGDITRTDTHELAIYIFGGLHGGNITKPGGIVRLYASSLYSSAFGDITSPSGYIYLENVTVGDIDTDFAVAGNGGGVLVTRNSSYESFSHASDQEGYPGHVQRFLGDSLTSVRGDGLFQFRYETDGKRVVWLNDANFGGTLSLLCTGLQYETGTGARLGDATLVGGTVDVPCASAGAGTRVTSLTPSLLGGVPGTLSYTVTNGVGITINSTSALDTSTVTYQLAELADPLPAGS